MISKYYFLTLYLASVAAVADSTDALSDAPYSNEKKGFTGQVGAAAVAMPSYIGSDRTDNKLLPLINVNYNDRLYFRYNRFGGWLYKSEQGLRLGALITTHRGIEQSDLPTELSTYGKRDSSTLAGVNVGYQYGRFWSEIAALKDVSDASDGIKFHAQMGYMFVVTDDYTLSANAKVEHLDDDIIDYYYSQNESVVNYSLSVVGTYKLTPKWTVIGSLSTTALADDISDSIIVENDNPTIALIGATYSF